MTPSGPVILVEWCVESHTLPMEYRPRNQVDNKIGSNGHARANCTLVAVRVGLTGGADRGGSVSVGYVHTLSAGRRVAGSDRAR